MKKLKLWLLALAAAPVMIQNASAQDTATDNDGVVLAQGNRAKPATPSAAAKGVAAEVNGQKIMLADLQRAVNAIRDGNPALSDGSEQAKQDLAVVQQQHMDHMIRRVLLTQEAKKRNIKATKEVVDKEVALYKQGVSDAEFEKALAADGKTMADFRNLLADDWAISELTQRITGDVVVTDAEISKYYSDNPDEFKMPETAKTSHILLAFKPNMSNADKEKLKARAAEILKQVKAKPANFAALAKQHSDDAASKNKGGNMGDEFFRDETTKEFADAVFSNKVGSIVGPLESAAGYHIVRVDVLKPASTMPLAQAKEAIRYVILSPQKKKAKLEEFIKNLMAAATIKRYV
jgi:parvulin-like peptidyl-prolyl isomerase